MAAGVEDVLEAFGVAPAHTLRVLSEEEYLRRGRRLVDLWHPLRDDPVPRFCLAGHEWVDGHEARP